MVTQLVESIVNLSHKDKQFAASVREIDSPLGYEDVYEVVVNDDAEAKKFLSWLEDRGGVAVWTSHEIGNYRMMYTPGDKNDQKPHYIMGLVEVVTDPKRIRIICELGGSGRKRHRRPDHRA